MLAKGAPSTAREPYNPNQATALKPLCEYFEGLDLTATYPGSERFMIGSFKYIKLTPTASDYLETFKELLRNRHAIAFTGLVPKGYGVRRPALVNNAHTAPQGFIKGSGHVFRFDRRRLKSKAISD